MDPEKKTLNAARRSRLVGEPSGLAACTSSTALFRSVHGSGKATWHGELPSSVDDGPRRHVLRVLTETDK